MHEHRVSTERLQLRTLTLSDCTPAYAGWLNDPEVNQFLETRFHGRQTLETVRAYVSGVMERDDEHLFGIFLTDGRRHVGNIKVGPVSPVHGVADMSLFIGDKDCWGTGLAAEAIAALGEYAFARLGVRKLSASMYAPNRGSIRAFEKAGWRHEGLRRDHYLLAGEPCDIVVLGLLEEDLG